MAEITLLAVPADVADDLVGVTLSVLAPTTEDLNDKVNRYLSNDDDAVLRHELQAVLDKTKALLILIDQLGLTEDAWPDGLNVVGDRAVLAHLIDSMLRVVGDEATAHNLKARAHLAGQLFHLHDILRR